MTRPLSHWLLLLALVAMWGSAFALTGIAVRGFSPATLVALRLAMAAALLSAFVLVRGGRFPTTARFWSFGLALSLAGNSIPFWLISFAQQRIDSGLAGILMGIMPLSTMALAHFFVPGERLNMTKASGFMLGFAGLVVLIGPEALLELRGQGSELLLYELAALGGALCYAVTTIIARHRPPADPLVAAAGVMVVGSLMMLPIGAPAAAGQLAVVSIGPLMALFLLGIVGTAIPTVMFLTLVAKAGPSFTSFINYLIPLWAVLMGFLFLGERPGPEALLALGLILAGIGLSEAGTRRMRGWKIRTAVEGCRAALRRSWMDHGTFVGTGLGGARGHDHLDDVGQRAGR